MAYLSRYCAALFIGRHTLTATADKHLTGVKGAGGRRLCLNTEQKEGRQLPVSGVLRKRATF